MRGKEQMMSEYLLQEMQPFEFDQVFSIMERSFPADEYRNYEEQKQLLQEKAYDIYVVRQCQTDRKADGAGICAFLSVWQFADFTYIEHFASEPSMRGQGLGSRILQEVLERFRHPVCLEVEPPQPDAAVIPFANRRIAFYIRNGFCLNEYAYIQPPVSKGKRALPLKIMTSGECVSKERFEEIRTQLYRSVYRQTEVQITVSQALETDVRSFLASILQKDEKLYSRFKIYAGRGLPDAQMEACREQMHELFGRYMENGNQIPEREAREVAGRIRDFLAEDVFMMLEAGHLAQAFALVCDIFTGTGAVSMGEADDEKGIVAAECVRIWKETARRADRLQKRQMYAWVISQLDGVHAKRMDYMEEYLEQFFMEAFGEREYLEEKLAFTEKQAEQGKESADSWNARYHVQKWALRHISLMEEAGSDFAQTADYCRRHWEYADIRKYYAEACIARKDNREAERTLQESLQMDAGMPGLVRQFSKRLKEVYRMSGRQEAYKKQLWQLETKDDAGNLNDFRELRQLYTEKEWQDVREELFQALPEHAHVERLYQEEELYDRLLAHVLSARGLYEVQQYQAVLKDLYPEQLLEKYTTELSQMVQRAADRRHYQEWAAHLERMLQMKGGQAAVAQLVTDWRKRYKNRPAMMEALKQF